MDILHNTHTPYDPLKSCSHKSTLITSGLTDNRSWTYCVCNNAASYHHQATTCPALWLLEPRAEKPRLHWVPPCTGSVSTLSLKLTWEASSGCFAGTSGLSFSPKPRLLLSLRVTPLKPAEEGRCCGRGLAGKTLQGGKQHHAEHEDQTC